MNNLHLAVQFFLQLAVILLFCRIVGAIAAHELAAMGIRITGVSDHTAAYFDPKGIDLAKIDAHVAKKAERAGIGAVVMRTLGE